MFDKEYNFRGKHAKYVKELVDRDQGDLFKRNIDVLIMAPVLGAYYNRQGQVDPGNENTKIFIEQLLNEELILSFIFKLVLLYCGKKQGNENIEEAFQTRENKETKKRNEEIFNSYVLGGVEFLHEKIVQDKFEKSSYVDSLFEFIREFNETIKIKYEEKPQEIYDLIKQYGEN